VNFENVAVSVAQDFFDVAPVDNKPVRLWGCWITQNNRKQDAQEEFLRIEIIRGFATVGAGGGTFTPVRQDTADAAAALTARINDTTRAVVGTGVTDVFWAEAFNDRAGWVWLPIPEMRPWCTSSDTRIVVALLAAPSAAMNMSGTLIVEEF
jgi:hypothetical protein